MNMKYIYGLMAAAIVVLLTSFSITTGTALAANCAGVNTAIIECTDGAGEDAIWGLLNVTIKILMGGVGILALAGIVYGAVVYSSAGGRPEQVKKAKGIFLNVAIGVVSFAAMFALLEFIVPGGVFN